MLRLATAGLVLVACTLTLFAQGGSPDVIVGDLIDTQNWGTSGTMTAYSVGTESCNIGNQNLTWNQNTNVHPVIAQNLYRLKNGRFEQLGMSWLKNGFYALSLNLCQPCQTGSPNGTWLGVGCSDPYGASLNGSQGLLSPRNQVNPVTGYFPYPGATYQVPDPVLGQRIRVALNDMNPAMNAGAQYFVEGHYIHPEDAAANNRNNNASWREVSVTATAPYNLNFIGSTHQMQPAIHAWQAADPKVQIQVFDIQGDGRVILAFKGTPTATPNIYHYEYAVQNLNSDRAIGSLTVELWSGANATNPVFHDVSYNDGEPYVGTDWVPVNTPGTLFPGNLTWACQTYAINPNANALRWGTMYNFAFDCDQLPGVVTLGIFKPSTGSSPATTITSTPFCAPQRPTPGPPTPYALQNNVAYDYVNIASTGTSGPSGDDNGMVVPIGFTFPFYGGTYTNVAISTNGYLALPSTGSAVEYANVSLPNAALPNGMIATYWDDLTMPGAVKYQTQGTAPNRRFIVYWNGYHLSNQTLPLQFEAILEEDGDIVTTIVQCPPSFGGATATRGIEAPNGTQGITLSSDTPNSATSGTSARFNVNSGIPISANLFHSGSLQGGPFRMVFTSGTGSPAGSAVLTWASLAHALLPLGPLGTIDIDLPTAIGIYDYYGILTGFPNPAAVTDAACNSLALQFWINPGSVPPGTTVYTEGVNWDLLNAPNGQFHKTGEDVIH